jgi:hypothetical protein
MATMIAPVPVMGQPCHPGKRDMSTTLPTMNPRVLSMLIATFVSGLTGCATSYPLGLTKSEWEMLPRAKQAEYRSRQKMIEARDSEGTARMRRAADDAIHESLRVESSLRQAADHAMYETQKLDRSP